MSEKKGFFGRLIDWAQQAPEKPEPETLPDIAPPPPGPDPDPAPPIPAAGLQPVAPVELPMNIPAAPPAEPIVVPHPAPAGPPEATPDFIEKVEADVAPEPEEVEDTPLPADEPDPIVPPPLEPVAVPVIAPVAVPVPQTVAAPTPAPAPAPRQNWFQRLASGLKRSSDQLTGGITALFTKSKLDATTLDDLEDILISADFGIETAATITDALRRERFERGMSPDQVRTILSAEVEKVLGPVAKPLVIDTAQKPFVILMAGVNGSGKTTTIGKLSQKLAAEGKSVMLAAGDTFRAAAIEQLQVWGKRTGAPVIARPAGADASGLAFDAVTEAVKQGTDVLIIDTEGRLQNRDELMSELEKILRVIRKVLPSAPHATLLTLDATTGQNALNQVEIFGQRAGITGLVMTKLDGTARGGILVAIARRFGLPVHFIGVGEGVDDLEPFTARDFAAAIAGLDGR